MPGTSDCARYLESCRVPLIMRGYLVSCWIPLFVRGTLNYAGYLVLCRVLLFVRGTLNHAGYLRLCWSFSFVDTWRFTIFSIFPLNNIQVVQWLENSENKFNYNFIIPVIMWKRPKKSKQTIELVYVRIRDTWNYWSRETESISPAANCWSKGPEESATRQLKIHKR